MTKIPFSLCCERKIILLIFTICLKIHFQKLHGFSIDVFGTPNGVNGATKLSWSSKLQVLGLLNVNQCTRSTIVNKVRMGYWMI